MLIFPCYQIFLREDKKYYLHSNTVQLRPQLISLLKTFSPKNWGHLSLILDVSSVRNTLLVLQGYELKLYFVYKRKGIGIEYSFNFVRNPCSE
jgi:hypothetical protein